MASPFRARITEWGHRIWAKLRSPEGIALLAITFIVGLAKALAWEEVTGFTRRIAGKLPEIASYPVGYFGLGLVLWIGLLLTLLFVAAFLETRSWVPWIKTRAENHALAGQVGVLEKQLAAEIELRDQWFQKYSFGRQLERMPPINPHDRAFMLGLAGDVEDDFKRAVKAAQAVIGEMNTIASEEENTGTSSLIEQIGEVQWMRLSCGLRNLRWQLSSENREPNRDPRPHLLVSYMLYAEWWMRFPVVARAVGRRLERLEAYPAWYQAHTDFQSRFWSAVKKEQLAPLGAPADFFNNESGIPALQPPLAGGGVPD